MKNLYIFGTKKNAEMAKFYFQRDCPQYKLIGFIEDTPEEDLVYGLPVISSADYLKKEQIIKGDIFAPLTSSSARKKIFKKFKSQGCSFASYISPQAHVWNRNALGENCFVQEFNNIQYGTRIGDNCLFWAGNHVGHHGNIGSHNTFTSHVVLSGSCNIDQMCYFGVNSTIGDGLHICSSVFVGMGSVITKNVTEEGVYIGVPARRIKSSEAVI